MAAAKYISEFSQRENEKCYNKEKKNYLSGSGCAGDPEPHAAPVDF